MLTRLRHRVARWLFSRTWLFEGVDLYRPQPDIFIKTYDGGHWGERGPDTRLVIRGFVAGRLVCFSAHLTKQQVLDLYVKTSEAKAAWYLWEHG